MENISDHARGLGKLSCIKVSGQTGRGRNFAFALSYRTVISLYWMIFPCETFAINCGNPGKTVEELDEKILDALIMSKIELSTILAVIVFTALGFVCK